MDKKEAKEFSSDAIYRLLEMVTLIDSQTEEIEFDSEDDFCHK